MPQPRRLSIFGSGLFLDDLRQFLSGEFTEAARPEQHGQMAVEMRGGEEG